MWLLYTCWCVFTCLCAHLCLARNHLNLCGLSSPVPGLGSPRQPGLSSPRPGLPEPLRSCRDRVGCVTQPSGLFFLDRCVLRTKACRVVVSPPTLYISYFWPKTQPCRPCSPRGRAFWLRPPRIAGPRVRAACFAFITVPIIVAYNRLYIRVHRSVLTFVLSFSRPFTD